MSRIKLIEQTSLTSASAFLFRLYALDAAWTEAVEQPDVPLEDLPELRKLVTEMDSALVETPNQAKMLEGVFVKHAEETEAACRRLLNDDPLAKRSTGDAQWAFVAEYKDNWRRMIKSAGGCHALALRSTHRLSSMADEERSLLAKKLHQLEANGKCEGDMRPEVICGGLVGGAIGFGLAGAWPAALLAGAAAGAYCGYYGVFD